MKRARPETPRVIIGDNLSGSIKRGGGNTQNDTLFKNFSNFMRQIIDSENDKFLNGDINVIDYVLAKYLKMNITDIQNLQKLMANILEDNKKMNKKIEKMGQNILNLKEENKMQ